MVREKLQPDEGNCAELVSFLAGIMRQSATFAFDFLSYAGSVAEKIINPGTSISFLSGVFATTSLVIGNIQQVLEFTEKANALFQKTGDKQNLAISSFFIFLTIRGKFNKMFLLFLFSQGGIGEQEALLPTSPWS